MKSFDSVSNLVESNGILYFIAKAGDSFEIWSSDGTSGGTRRVDALYPGGDNFAAYNLHSVDGSLFFSASGPDGVHDGAHLALDEPHLLAVDGGPFSQVPDVRLSQRALRL